MSLPLKKGEFRPYDPIAKTELRIKRSETGGMMASSDFDARSNLHSVVRKRSIPADGAALAAVALARIEGRSQTSLDNWADQVADDFKIIID